MTIDEAIESLKSDYEIDMYIRDIAPQLAEWLEELKRLRDNYERAYAEGRDKGYACGEFNGYNKSIDDFVNKLKEEIFNGYATLEDYFEDSIECVAVEDINRIAEQLKAGGSNE